MFGQYARKEKTATRNMKQEKLSRPQRFTPNMSSNEKHCIKSEVEGIHPRRRSLYCCCAPRISCSLSSKSRSRLRKRPMRSSWEPIKRSRSCILHFRPQGAFNTGVAKCHLQQRAFRSNMRTACKKRGETTGTPHALFSPLSSRSSILGIGTPISQKQYDATFLVSATKALHTSKRYYKRMSAHNLRKGVFIHHYARWRWSGAL